MSKRIRPNPKLTGYTFEYRFDSSSIWARSLWSHVELSAVAARAAEWLEVCWRNDSKVEVRLVEIA